MNFSTLKGLTIPEGVVTQIADESGRVIWSAVKKATITLKNNTYPGIITYNGVQQTSTFTANIGDTIEITRIAVALNDPNATPTETPNSMMYKPAYYYTVVSDATFECKSKFSGVTSTGMYYLLSITEIPEVQILFTIRSENYFAEKGMTWGEWVNSAYNVDGYKIGSSDYVYTSNEAFYVTASGYNTPKRDTKILSGVTYRTEKY